ncbi:aspartyl/asparaginyl beta-hydroxylase domain-containing protein [Phenylobacterium sp.]|jgi:aspartyl/asparaginyl beta-hydroxylase (cupin superfamily)|uniref:aspartyl/asparaginyl beta-hydroxylase domain-containing protein n=1 Tax=Phenylobacterium sp. TaxID=1871053 RepID=UPI002F93D2D9
MSTAAAAPEDLGRQAHEAFRRGDAGRALSLVAQAEAAFPKDLSFKLQKAMIRRATGDLAGALEALEEALAIDPYDFVSLLSKAGLVEQISGERAATPIYKNALKIAPAEDEIPPALRRPTERARELVARTTDRLDEHLRTRTAALAAACSEAARRRFDEAIGVLTGKRRIYVQEPLLLHYPQLPAIPFYDRNHFPWLPELEAATEVIREELMGALEAAKDDFAPYIAYPKDAPVNQWGELNHSRRWSSLFLWKDGARQDAACALCPRTAALLERLPLARQPGFAPTAMFSALDAHTHIPPHTGSTNARLLCHLPLVLPGPARLRVGAETREWRMGEAWVFDDTIEHEAWNDADELRVILIFDVWNPYLEPGERELITALLQARNEFFAGA